MVYDDFVASVQYVRHQPGGDRRHVVDERDVRVVLSRVPSELVVRLKKITFNDRSRGGKTFGYTTVRGRADISLCAQPPRLRFRDGEAAGVFGAVAALPWPILSLRRWFLYEVLLHEIGHLQVVAPRASSSRRRFGDEKVADSFAAELRAQLWSEPFDHPDPVHRAPSAAELHAVESGWKASCEALEAGITAEKNEEATTHYRRAVELYPENSEALIRLGSIVRSADLESALTYLASAYRLDPADPGIELTFAEALLATGQEADANSHFERASRVEFPERPELMRRFARTLVARGDLERASRVFRSILRKYPKPAAAHAAFGEVLLRHGHQEEAARHFEKALKIDPSNARARSGLILVGEKSAEAKQK